MAIDWNKGDENGLNMDYESDFLDAIWGSAVGELDDDEDSEQTLLDFDDEELPW